MAKQSGRGCGVKSVKRVVITWLAAGAALAQLSGCASTWHNPQRTPQEAKMDEQACAKEAEETTLTRSAQQKVEYGRNNGPLPNLSRGETPMQLQQRSRTEDLYAREFESCMTGKGYSQGKSEN